MFAQQVDNLRNRHAHNVSTPITTFFGIAPQEDPVKGDFNLDISLIAMPFRDRTQEFRTTGASYQMKIQANVPKANLDGRQQLIKESIEFNQLSKRISRDLTSTCAKLEKLAELAKRKSLFEDKGNDIEELAKVVKQDITGLNKQIALLMEYGKQRVGSHNQSQDHSKLVVVGLQSKLANVSKTYQDVLGVRTENMKQIRNRAGMYSQTQQQRTNGPMLPNSSTKSLLLMDDERKHGVALDMDGLEQEQLQNQAMILDETEGYLRSRNTAMETIEKNIHEIGSIFSQLATLVAEQGDMITRIDSNVEQSSINIEGAHHENPVMARSVPLSGIVLLSFTATMLAVTHAFWKKEQFYPAMIYLTKHSFSLFVLYFQGAVLTYLVAQLIRKIFFGPLRDTEVQHCYDQAWQAVMETILAFAVFREEFSYLHVVCFALLLIVKCFHWLMECRVGFMERSPNISTLFKVRMVTTLSCLFFLDIYFFWSSLYQVLHEGNSVHTIFAFEYAVMFVSIIHITLKCGVQVYESTLPGQNWPEKSTYLLYISLGISLCNFVIHAVFLYLMVKILTLPLFLMRPVWMSFINLKKIFSDVKQCRQAVHAMNTRFPEVGEEELARIDITCIICRDDMTRVGEPKKLPCGHVFHKNCLRNWFQHQRTCPTCRCNVLDENPPNRNQGPVNNNNNNNGNAQPNANNNNNNQFPNFFQNVFNNMGGNAQPPNNNNPVPPNQPNNPNNGNIPNMPPFNFANLPPLPPLFPSAHINVFPQPPNYAGMSEEELLTMELNTREAIVARIEALNNITTLLDAVRMQFEQYNALPVVVQNIQSRSPPPTTSSEEANTSGSTLRSTSSVIGETFNNSHGTSTRATGGLSNDNLNSSSGSAGTGVSSDMVFNSTADSPGSVPSVGVRDVLNDTQGSSGSNVQSAGGASGRLTSDLLNSNPGSPSIGRSDHLNSSQGSASIGRSDNLNSPQDSTGRSDLSNSTQDSTSTGRSDILKNSLSSNRNKSIDNPTDTAIANGTTSSIEHNESTSTAIAADQTPNPFESLSQMEAMRRRRIENLDKKTNSTEEGDNSH